MNHSWEILNHQEKDKCLGYSMQIFEREVGERWNVSLLLEECLKEIESLCLMEIQYTQRECGSGRVREEKEGEKGRKDGNARESE